MGKYIFKNSTANVSETLAKYEATDNIADIIKAMEDEMNQAAGELAFEKAAKLRDQIRELKNNGSRLLKT